jgi:hypothetical protein
MKVSWDDYSQSIESHKIHVPKQQPDGNFRILKWRYGSTIIDYYNDYLLLTMIIYYYPKMEVP